MGRFELNEIQIEAVRNNFINSVDDYYGPGPDKDFNPVMSAFAFAFPLNNADLRVVLPDNIFSEKQYVAVDVNYNHHFTMHVFTESYFRKEIDAVVLNQLKKMNGIDGIFKRPVLSVEGKLILPDRHNTPDYCLSETPVFLLFSFFSNGVFQDFYRETKSDSESRKKIIDLQNGFAYDLMTAGIRTGFPPFWAAAFYDKFLGKEFPRIDVVGHETMFIREASGKELDELMNKTVLNAHEK